MKDERYSRQRALAEIGAGQEKIEHGVVAVVGMGALGSVAADLLARAGVGTLILVDRDVVEESNLQRQTLYEEKDVGRSKVVAAKEKLLRVNGGMDIKIHALHLNAANIGLLGKAAIILDCTDNLQTRFLLNDFCRREKISLVYGAAVKTTGYAMPILSAGPCLRCFLQEANLETCETVGVLNTITAAIAALQVTLALQIAIGKEVEPVLYHYNIWNQEFKKVKVNQNKDCRACEGRYDYLKKREEVRAVKFCSSGRYQVMGRKIDLLEVKKRWEKLGAVIDDGVTLSFKNMVLFEDGRALIKSSSEEKALAEYSKWVGN